MDAIDTYVETRAGPQKSALQRIRQFVRTAAPGAEEAISYGMPAFKYKKRYLSGYFAFKNHMSIFPGAVPVAALGDKLIGFKLSKGTIQFTIDNPIPKYTILDIVNIRLTVIDKNGK